MILTLAAVAAHKKIRLSKLTVTSRLDRQEFPAQKPGTTISTTVTLNAGLTDREKKILFRSARFCEINRILRNPIQWVETLEEE